MQAISALELIGAIGGVIFFIFLVLAICAKSQKNWEEASDEKDQCKVSPEDPQNPMNLSKEELVREKQARIKEAKMIEEELYRKKLRMIHIMRHKERSIDFFLKKQSRWQRNQEMQEVESQHNMTSMTDHTCDSQASFKNSFTNTRLRMRELIQRKLSIIASQVDESSRDSIEESIEIEEDLRRKEVNFSTFSKEARIHPI